MLKRTVQIIAYQVAAFSVAASTALAGHEPGHVSAVDPTSAPFSDLGLLLRNALSIVFFLAGLLSFVYLLIGGLQWITSGGDMKAAAAARDRITAALVGLIIIVAAFAITLVLEKVFGIRILSGVNFNPAQNVVGD